MSASSSHSYPTASLKCRIRLLVSALHPLFVGQQILIGGIPIEIYNITYSLPLENDTEPQMSSQYYERLRESSLATQKLIAAFLQLVPNAAIPEMQDLRSQTAAFRADAAVHRSEARMLRSKLQDTVDELQTTREKLVAAENRVERVRSETVVVLEAKLGKPLSVEVEKTKSEEKQANGSPIVQVCPHIPIWSSRN